MALSFLWRQTTPLDRWLVLLLLLLAAGLWVWLWPQGRGRQLVVERQGRIIYTAPLEGRREFSLSGPLGETRLRLEGGRVRVLESPCPNKECMRRGEIGAAGEILACVPNQLLVRIEGTAPEPRGEIDVLSR